MKLLKIKIMLNLKMNPCLRTTILFLSTFGLIVLLGYLNHLSSKQVVPKLNECNCDVVNKTIIGYNPIVRFCCGYVCSDVYIENMKVFANMNSYQQCWIVNDEIVIDRPRINIPIIILFYMFLITLGYVFLGISLLHLFVLARQYYSRDIIPDRVQIVCGGLIVCMSLSYMLFSLPFYTKFDTDSSIFFWTVDVSGMGIISIIISFLVGKYVTIPRLRKLDQRPIIIK